MKKTQNIIFYSLIALYFVQVILMTIVSQNSLSAQHANSSIDNCKSALSIAFVDNTVRTQQRMTLSAIKQSWMNYTITFDKKLIEKDEYSNPIYANANSQIAYNSSKMHKDLISSNFYNIYDEENNLILENATPQWNIANLKEILNIIVEPQKNFGNSGGFIVYDSYSGQVFLDTTNQNRLTIDKNYNIFYDDESRICKNKYATKDAIINYLMLRKDTDGIENFTYLFCEENNVTNDFQTYPLGNYSRQFIEKIILPYESFGFNGQPMQLTILSVVDENDISSAFKSNIDTIDKTMDNISNNHNIIIISIYISFILNMLMLIITVYVFKYGAAYYSKK